MNDSIFRGGQYRPLSKEQVKTIHEASLTILEQVGLTCESGIDDILELIEKKGVEVDREKSRLKFSRDMVVETVSKAPDRVLLYSRDGENDIDLNNDQVHFGTGGTVTQILDLETGECRPSTIKDFYQIARLADQLQNIDLLIRPLTPTDVPVTAYDANIMFAGLKGTRKHFNTGIFLYESFYDALDIASTVAGGLERLREKPFISIHTTFMISPLKISTVPTRIMVEAVKNGIPVTLNTGPMAGATGPITLAGTLALMHAELLSGIVISQLINPGTPIIYTAAPTCADMRTMNFIAGTIEAGMMTAAAHQLARHINLPNIVSAGWTDSKVADAQAGWESALTLVLAAMGGNNCVRHAAGMIESGMTLAYEHFVTNDEIIGMAGRVLKGIEVSEDSIALEVIKNVGPGGNFITLDHTYKHMRSELFYGNGVTDRNLRASWKEEGSKDALARANSMVKEILAKPEKSYISSDVDRMIREKYNIRL